MRFLLVTFYVSMAAAAFIIEAIFGWLGLAPTQRQAQVIEATISWNYTTWLNITLLLLAALLVWRFLRTGGPEMLRIMNRPGTLIVTAQPTSGGDADPHGEFEAIITPTPNVNARSSACSGPKRKSALATDHRSVTPRGPATASSTKPGAGLGRRHELISDILNERLTKIRLTMASPSAYASARISFFGIPRMVTHAKT